jgi:protein-disulfide isomerase
MQLTLLVGPRDHSIGPADALVTLVEYGSYDCSHCRSAAQTVRAIQIEFGGQLRRVFRHFPRAMMQSLSALAAEAAEAASQGKFWQIHEALLARRETKVSVSLH